MSASSRLDDWLIPIGSTGSLKKKSINYVFSKSDNGLVDIATVTDRKRLEQKVGSGLHDQKVRGGLLDSNYVCSGCGGNVVARLGSKNAHHFAHHTTTNCIGNPTTNLHNLAEEIIIKQFSVYLPFLTVKSGGSRWLKVCNEDRSFLALQASGEQTDNETKRVPDVVLALGSYELIIEVAVTHFCDDEKKKEYRDAKKPSIEVDLSRVRRNISKADLTKLLMGDCSKPDKLFSWIYHPNYDAALIAIEFEEDVKRQKKIAKQERIKQEVEEKARLILLKAQEKAKLSVLQAEKDKKYWRNQQKKSLGLLAKGVKLTNCQQDLVWYYHVYKKKMRAADWKYKRSQLSDICTYLDNIVFELGGQIAEEKIIRVKENETKRLLWLDAALAKNPKGLPFTDIEQDLIWHHEVINNRMAAIDWKAGREKLKRRCYLLDSEVFKYKHEIQMAEEAIEKEMLQAKYALDSKKAKVEQQRKQLIEDEIEAYLIEKFSKERRRYELIAKTKAREKTKVEEEKSRLKKLCADSTETHNRLIEEHFRRRKAGLPYDLNEARRAIANNITE